jgi:hypothetical protein
MWGSLSVIFFSQNCQGVSDGGKAFMRFHKTALSIELFLTSGILPCRRGQFMPVCPH